LHSPRILFGGAWQFFTSFRHIKAGCAMNSNEQPTEREPSSLRQPWWLGKAHHKDILLQFIVICVIVALLFLGTVIYLSQPV